MDSINGIGLLAIGAVLYRHGIRHKTSWSASVLLLAIAVSFLLGSGMLIRGLFS